MKYGEASEDATTSQSYDIIQNHFVSTYADDLGKLVGEENLTFEKMTDICGYLYWAKIDGKVLKFEVSDNVLNYCAATGDAKLYGVSYGVPELWELGAFEFLT